MPIHYAAEPVNGSALVQRGLDHLSQRRSPLSPLNLDFSKLAFQPPHAVYDLRADTVANGGGLNSATNTGFRYIVQGAGANVAAAELVSGAAANSPLLANFNYGPYVEATATGLAKVSALAPVTKGSFEARLLRFSAIHLIAIWLKPDAGGDDIIYPLAPAPEGINAEQAYSETDFLKLIRPLAEKRAAPKDRGQVP